MMNGNPMMGGGGIDPAMLKAIQLAMAQGAQGMMQPGMSRPMIGQNPVGGASGGQGMDAATMLAMMRQRMGGMR